MHINNTITLNTSSMDYSHQNVYKQTVNSFWRQNLYTPFSFQRILTPEELKQSSSALNEFWKLLNKKITFLTPESALPTPLYGSRNSKEGIEFYKFWGNWVHNFLDLPRGKTSGNIYKEGHSPYAATVFSRNPLSLSLERLTNKTYAHLLPQEEFQTFYKEALERTTQTPHVTDYEYIYQKQEEILKKAWENYKKKNLLMKHKLATHLHKEELKSLSNLNKEFKLFKNQNNKQWLEKDSIFYALQKFHGEEDYTKWKSELDRNLFRWLESNNATDTIFKEYAQKRLKELQDPLNYDIYNHKEYYKFVQFLLEKQELETAKIIKKPFGIDIPTGQSQTEEWAYPSAFFKDRKVGVQPEPGNPDGQIFVFKAHDLTKNFLKDFQGKVKTTLWGKPQLGETGQYLQNKFEFLFKRNKGSIRVDFPRGYVNPLVIKETAPNATYENGARYLFTSPADPYFKKYSLINEHLVDSTKNPLDPQYVKQDIFKAENKHIVNKLAGVFDFILKPLLKKYNKKPNQFHLEMLGPQPNEFKAVVQNKHNMAGEMHVAQYMNTPNFSHVHPHDQMVIANHDTKSIFKWAEDLTQNPDLKQELEQEARELALLTKTDENILKQNPYQLAKAKIIQGIISKAGELVIDWQSIFLNTADQYKQRYNSFETVDIAKKSNNFRRKMSPEWMTDYYKGLEDGKALNFFDLALDIMKIKREEILKKLSGKQAIEKYNSLFKELEYWRNELMIPEPVNYRV